MRVAIRERLLRWLRRDSRRELQVREPPEPFIRTRCPDCGSDIVWEESILPGTAAIVQCTCEERWAAVAPTVQIVRAKELKL